MSIVRHFGNEIFNSIKTYFNKSSLNPTRSLWILGCSLTTILTVLTAVFLLGLSHEAVYAKSSNGEPCQSNFGAIWYEWDNGGYHYIVRGFDVNGDSNDQANGTNDATEIDTFQCGNATGQYNIPTYRYQGYNVVPTTVQIGVPNMAAQNIDNRNGQNGNTTFWYEQTELNPSNRACYIRGSGCAPTPSDDRPPVFRQDYASAAGLVNDAGRAILNNQTIWCQAYKDINSTGKTQCPPPNIDPNSQTYCLGATNATCSASALYGGAGYLIAANDCNLNNRNAPDKGKDIDLSGPDAGGWDCNGSPSPYTWYSDQLGTTSTDLTGIVGTTYNAHEDQNALKNSFDLEMSARNTYKSGFEAGMFMTFAYPIACPNGDGGNLGTGCVPIISGSGSCGNLDMVLHGHPGAAVNWSYVNDGTTVSGNGNFNGAGDYTINMSTADQIQTIQITANGKKFPYGPCYSVSCNDTVIPAIVEPNQTFTVNANIPYRPIGAAPGNGPSKDYGQITISVGGASFKSNNPPTPYAPSTMTYSVPTSEPTPGMYAINVSYADGAPLTTKTNCTALVETVGYMPYLSVTGGDVSAGGGFENATGACTNPNPDDSGILAFNNGPTASPPYEGSGTNLSDLAADVIIGFASSQGISPPSSLSFANTITDSILNGGQFGTAYCAQDYYDFAQKPPPVAAPSVDLSNLPSPAPYSNGGTNYYNYTNAGGVDITTPVNYTLPAGSRNVIFVSGNVEIDNNINLYGYDNAGQSWNNINQIPSLYIVTNGNIYINKNVSELNGVFVAQGTGSSGHIFTCTEPNFTLETAASLYANCSSHLNVDGSFIANQVDFERTYGDVANQRPGQTGPAESFEYNPEMWLVNPFNNSTTEPSNPVYVSATALAPIL